MTRSPSWASKAARRLADPLSGPEVEMAEHAIIQRSDNSPGEYPQVTGVRIGVKEPEFEDLSQQNPRSLNRDLLRVERPCGEFPRDR